MDGHILHEKAHDGSTDSRGDLLITRSMPVRSAKLGISGQCDVVEFHRSSSGVTLSGRKGSWQPYPIEYKRGAPKLDACDELQLCAQAMCLEEMLCCTIPEGALYYGETRHRVTVEFTAELREQVRAALKEMHELYSRGHTPTVKPRKGCSACSMKELCMPKLMKASSVQQYLRRNLEDSP